MKNRPIILTSLIILVLAGGGVLAWRLSSRQSATSQSSGNSSSQKSAPISTPPANGSQPVNETPKTYLVKVYFSRHPDSDNDPSLTFPVSRISSSLGLARVAVSSLLKGPTVSEQDKGYFTTAHLRSDASNCNNQDFTVSIQSSTATLRFCRPFEHLGVVADGQAKSEIEATLKQFSSVKKAVILNYKGDCEFDLSGMNLCKQ